MYGTFKNDPLVPLITEFRILLQEANLLAIVNKKLAKQRYDKAQCLALQITAISYRN